MAEAHEKGLGRIRSTSFAGRVVGLEREFETLGNVSFETLVEGLGLKKPTEELTVNTAKSNSINFSQQRSITSLESDGLALDIDHHGIVWIGEGVKIGTLQLNLDYFSVLVITPEAKIAIIKVKGNYDSLMVIGPNVNVVEGSLSYESVFLHTSKTRLALESKEHDTKIQKYGGNIYIPEAREQELTRQLLDSNRGEEQLRVTQQRLKELVAGKQRIISELQGH